MMERLREGVNSIAVKIILGLIILSFVFAGVGSYIVGGGSNAAAKVNNTEIGRGAFEQAYTNERNRMQSQMGDYFANLLADPTYVQSFRKSILDRMVNELLLEQYADSLGLRISDKQIRQQILSMPEFQNDGKFDQEVYAATLRRAGYNADSFAEYLRREMTRQQILFALQGSEFSLDSEVTTQSQLLTQTRDIRSILLNIEDYSKSIELTDEELQEYYDANSSNYTRPEQVKVAYVELSAQELKSQVAVSDEQAQAYYQENLDKYSSIAQRQLSHILVQGDDEAKAQAILDELNSGADFIELAKTKSEDIGSSEEGGSLGWVEKDVMDPEFEAAAFALQNVGDNTGLVKSAFGYHIIKLDGLKEAQATPFAEVEAEIKVEIAEQQAVERFYELQTELEKVAFEYPDSLDDSAQAIDQPIKTTDFISRSDAPELLLTPAVMQAILSADVKEDGLNSEVIEVAPEHVVVVRVEDSRDETVLPFEDVKEQVNSELALVKGEQKALDLANLVLEGLKAGDESTLSTNGLEFGEIETIDRRSPLAQTVFALAKPESGDKTYAQATDLDRNIVIVELSKVSINEDDSFNTQIAAQLVRTGTQQDLAAVVSTLREEADIEYYAVDTQP
ncbi:peptidylprolyl isomerase [Vibrio algarum]|uniref:Periplasmic chaperone PpiD n=1 Tax=Vibrio algarum TaxID=3020714 RepID=A0ABT4YSH0_9VIBR|nr:peptidylprolyl isomerase [Vibrio sp. KJ40-1]MDB1124486.1 peptidylprolyl isomerase [Vibrio sp. KJ40-1]